MSVYRYMNKLVQLATATKKPATNVMQQIFAYVNTQVKHVDNDYVFPKKHEFHARAVKDALNLPGWIFYVLNFKVYKLLGWTPRIC